MLHNMRLSGDMLLDTISFASRSCHFSDAFPEHLVR